MGCHGTPLSVQGLCTALANYLFYKTRVLSTFGGKAYYSAMVTTEVHIV